MADGEEGTSPEAKKGKPIEPESPDSMEQVIEQSIMEKMDKAYTPKFQALDSKMDEIKGMLSDLSKKPAEQPADYKPPEQKPEPKTEEPTPAPEPIQPAYVPPVQQPAAQPAAYVPPAPVPVKKAAVGLEKKVEATAVGPIVVDGVSQCPSCGAIVEGEATECIICTEKFYNSSKSEPEPKTEEPTPAPEPVQTAAYVPPVQQPAAQPAKKSYQPHAMLQNPEKFEGLALVLAQESDNTSFLTAGDQPFLANQTYTPETQIKLETTLRLAEKGPVLAKGALAKAVYTTDQGELVVDTAISSVSESALTIKTEPIKLGDYGLKGETRPSTTLKEVLVYVPKGD